jgi:hypothetical protein
VRYGVTFGDSTELSGNLLADCWEGRRCGRRVAGWSPSETRTPLKHISSFHRMFSETAPVVYVWPCVWSGDLLVEAVAQLGW